MTRQRVVVGIDGSENSKQALRWAVDHARRIDGTVDAVTVWEVPLSIIVVPTAEEQDYADHATAVLQAVLDDVVGPESDVPISAHIEEGRAARVLARVAEDADLLVVGSHGRGELPGMHLGTVATYLVHHAPCPVVVLRSG